MSTWNRTWKIGVVLFFITIIIPDQSADQRFNVIENREFYGTQIFSTANAASILECADLCDKNVACAAVMFDGTTGRCTGLSNKGDLMIGKVNNAVKTCVKGGAWVTAFIGKAGIGTKVYPLWTGTTSSSTGTKYAESCNCHYKSELVEKWSEIGIEKVKLALFVSNTEKASMVFDGKNTDKMSWFHSQRVVTSPWTDLKSAPHNYFSIVGHYRDISQGALERRFYMNSFYNGCEHDTGWLVVVDFTGKGIACYSQYENGQIPVILFSDQTTMSNWNAVTAKRADSFKIFIQFQTTNKI